MGGILGVILGSKQAAYCDLYRKADWPMRKTEGYNVLLGSTPPFALPWNPCIALLAFLAYDLARQSGEMVEKGSRKPGNGLCRTRMSI